MLLAARVDDFMSSRWWYVVCDVMDEIDPPLTFYTEAGIRYYFVLCECEVDILKNSSARGQWLSERSSQ
jgi:hypothetical protein